MIDYLIIGSGLAGMAFAETAIASDKSVFVFDSNQHSSSKVAAGLYNPVILKRFTPVWEAQNQLILLDEFYRNLEAKLHQQFDFKKPILRRFFSLEEQNNWYIACDKMGLFPFLSTKLYTDRLQGIDAPFDYGEVKATGYVDVAKLLDSYNDYLRNLNSYVQEQFDYDLLKIHIDHVEYKNITARHIVFAEGFGMHQNPFFCDLTLDGVKGELLIIKAPNLELDVIVNTSIFILPIGNKLFKVGATYNWIDKTDKTTAEGRQELTKKLMEVLNCEFEVISHYAGVRPTVKDRKPLVGTHPDFKNVHILNGLGTRGVMLGPSMAKALFEFIEEGTPLVPEIDIKRFRKK